MTPERFEEIRNIINDHSFVCDERGALAIELFDECDSLRSQLAKLQEVIDTLEREKDDAFSAGYHWAKCDLDPSYRGY